MPGCAVLGCSNSTRKGYIMKPFPRNPERFKLWAEKMNRPGWTPTKHSCICEVHFEPGMIFKKNGRYRLRPDAVPTIFPKIKKKESEVIEVIAPKKVKKRSKKQSSPKNSADLLEVCSKAKQESRELHARVLKLSNSLDYITNRMSTSNLIKEDTSKRSGKATGSIPELKHKSKFYKKLKKAKTQTFADTTITNPIVEHEYCGNTKQEVMNNSNEMHIDYPSFEPSTSKFNGTLPDIICVDNSKFHLSEINYGSDNFNNINSVNKEENINEVSHISNEGDTNDDDINAVEHALNIDDFLYALDNMDTENIEKQINSENFSNMPIASEENICFANELNNSPPTIAYDNNTNKDISCTSNFNNKVTSARQTSHKSKYNLPSNITKKYEIKTQLPVDKNILSSIPLNEINRSRSSGDDVVSCKIRRLKTTLKLQRKRNLFRPKLSLRERKLINTIKIFAAAEHYEDKSSSDTTNIVNEPIMKIKPAFKLSENETNAIHSLESVDEGTISKVVNRKGRHGINKVKNKQEILNMSKEIEREEIIFNDITNQVISLNSNKENHNWFSHELALADIPDFEGKKKLIEQVKQYETKIEKMTVALNSYKSQISRVMSSLKSITKGYRADIARQVFNPDQIEAILRKYHNLPIAGLRWSNTTILQALKLMYLVGNEAYSELLNQNFPYPAIRTLDKIMINVERIQNGKVCNVQNDDHIEND